MVPSFCWIVVRRSSTALSRSSLFGPRLLPLLDCASYPSAPAAEGRDWNQRSSPKFWPINDDQQRCHRCR